MPRGTKQNLKYYHTHTHHTTTHTPYYHTHTILPHTHHTTTHTPHHTIAGVLDGDEPALPLLEIWVGEETSRCSCLLRGIPGEGRRGGADGYHKCAGKRGGAANKALQSPRPVHATTKSPARACYNKVPGPCMPQQSPRPVHATTQVVPKDCLPVNALVVVSSETRVSNLAALCILGDACLGLSGRNVTMNTPNTTQVHPNTTQVHPQHHLGTPPTPPRYTPTPPRYTPNTTQVHPQHHPGTPPTPHRYVTSEHPPTPHRYVTSEHPQHHPGTSQSEHHPGTPSEYLLQAASPSTPARGPPHHSSPEHHHSSRDLQKKKKHQ